MSVMSGACVSLARLHAAEGAPMPTKQTSSFFKARAAAIVIISVARDRIPRLVEGIVATVVTVGIRGPRPAGRYGDGAHGPARQYHRVRARRIQPLDYLLDRHDRPRGRQHRFLLNSDDAFHQHVSLSIGALRVDDGDVGS